MSTAETYDVQSGDEAQEGLQALEAGSGYSNESRRFASTMEMDPDNIGTPETVQALAEMQALLEANNSASPEDAAMFTLMYGHLLGELRSGNEAGIERANHLVTAALKAHTMRSLPLTQEQQEGFTNAYDYVIAHSMAAPEMSQTLVPPQEVIAENNLRLVGEGAIDQAEKVDVPYETRLHLQQAGFTPTDAFLIERTLLMAAEEYASDAPNKQVDAAREQVDALLDMVHANSLQGLPAEKLNAIQSAARDCFDAVPHARDRFKERLNTSDEIDPATYVVLGPMSALSGEESRLEKPPVISEAEKAYIVGETTKLLEGNEQFALLQQHWAEMRKLLAANEWDKYVAHSFAADALADQIEAELSEQPGGNGDVIYRFRFLVENSLPVPTTDEQHAGMSAAMDRYDETHPDTVRLTFDDEDPVDNAPPADAEAGPEQDVEMADLMRILELHPSFTYLTMMLDYSRRLAEENDMETFYREVAHIVSISNAIANGLELNDDQARLFRAYINESTWGLLSSEQRTEVERLQKLHTEPQTSGPDGAATEVLPADGDQDGSDKDDEPEPTATIDLRDTDRYKEALAQDAEFYGISPELLEVLDRNDLEPVIGQLAQEMEMVLWSEDIDRPLGPGEADVFETNREVLDQMIAAYYDAGELTAEQVDELNNYIGESLREAYENRMMRYEAHQEMVYARDQLAQVEATYRRRGNHEQQVDTFAAQYRAALEDAESRDRDLRIDARTGAIMVFDRATGQPVQENVSLPFVNAEIKQIAAARVHYEMALEEYAGLQEVAIYRRMEDMDQVGDGARIEGAVRDFENNLVATEYMERSLAESSYFADNRSQQIASALSRMSRPRLTALAGAVGLTMGGVPGLIIAGGAAGRAAYRGMRGEAAQRAGVVNGEMTAAAVRSGSDVLRAQVQNIEDPAERWAALSRSLNARAEQFSRPEALRGTIDRFNRTRQRARVGQRFNNTAAGEWLHRDARPRALEDMVLRAARLQQRGTEASVREADRIMNHAQVLSEQFGMRLPDTRTLEDARRRATFSAGGSLDWRAGNRRIERARQRNEAARRLREELGLDQQQGAGV